MEPVRRPLGILVAFVGIAALPARWVFASFCTVHSSRIQVRGSRAARSRLVAAAVLSDAQPLGNTVLLEEFGRPQNLQAVSC
mmetsp:Transcript_29769/g.69208  ORF Transcript_29769/g.69208 Transcript_29769/m.69208 type:complete len:82 (+) Transcript_29769:62-307(+)